MPAFEIMKNVRVGLSSVRAPGWRTTWSRRAALLAFAGGGATSFGGCGSVAGPEYTGEVGLELRGKVVSVEGASADRVPVLAFLGDQKLYLMDGHITGEFPSQFAFRVDEPPPEGALRALEGAPNDAEVAIAFLAMAPKDHPPTVALNDVFWRSTTVDEAGEPDPETGIFARTTTVCFDEGDRCQTKTYACKAEPCETLIEVGPSEVQGGVTGGGVECVGNSCLTYDRPCEEGVCSATVAICENVDLDDTFSSDGAVDRCTLRNVEGHLPPIATLSENFASDFLVYFSTAPFARDGVELRQGYSLVQSVRAEKNEWAESLLCRLDADAVYGSAGDGTPEELRDRLLEAKEKCPEAQRWEVIDNPTERQLTISLGHPRQMP